MPELRTAPAKPDTKFWDAEARKLMLIDYRIYWRYVKPPVKMRGLGAMGLSILGFREPSSKQHRNGSECEITQQHGRRLVLACQRLARQIYTEKENRNASTLHADATHQ